MADKLTDLEKDVYNFIKGRGELLTSNIPDKMSGVIPDLEKKRLVEVFKKKTSRWSSRKRKFVRISRLNNDS